MGAAGGRQREMCGMGNRRLRWVGVALLLSNPVMLFLDMRGLVFIVFVAGIVAIVLSYR